MVKKQTIKLSVFWLLLVLLIGLVYLTVETLYGLVETKNTTQKNLEIVDSKIKIGFSLGTLKEERWIKDRDILMAKVKELGAGIIVQNANNDDQDQLKQVRYLLDQNIDVLIIVPNDLEKASYAVDLAKKQGVKVISYDRLVLRSNVDMYISFDNVKVGELMAKYVVDKIVGNNILIINGPTSDYNTKMIKEGYDRMLETKLEQGKLTLVTEEWAPNWMKEYAFKVVDEFIQNGEPIDAVIAGNDGLADGVIQALSEHRAAGRTIVVGQDADLTACQRVVEGTQLMTVYKPIDKLTEVTAKIAIKMAKGENIEVDKTIYDGKYHVPYYILEPIPVDKDNIDDTVIKDGFHLQNEVYRNLPQ